MDKVANLVNEIANNQIPDTKYPFAIVLALDCPSLVVYNFSPSGNGKRGENPPLPRNCIR
jgi:hypothetical protein